jgi:hypothetical protein
MYGRNGDLKKLNNDRNNSSLSRLVRYRANEAHAKIVKQLKDTKLMALRLRLIRATRAGNMEISSRIQLQMRDHLKQDKETGQ